jgi:diguanylate cyclase (GGDEF)-like protein
VAARIGGDEFVLILRGVTDTARLHSIARRIIGRIEEPVPYAGTFCRISASAGITVSTHYAQPDAEKMLHDADTALYTSKRAGRARATLHAVAGA